MRTDCTALILAGGRSSRMGRDKALLELDGATLTQRAADFWRGQCGRVLLSVGGAARSALAPPGVEPVLDAFSGCGPMAGVQAGLRACETDLLAVSAVDMPYLNETGLQTLLNAIGDADACVYSLDGRPDPLFGLYRRSCLPVAERLLGEGERRMSALLRGVRTVLVPCGDAALLRNVNTPEEYQGLEGRP